MPVLAAGQDTSHGQRSGPFLSVQPFFASPTGSDGSTEERV